MDFNTNEFKSFLSQKAIEYSLENKKNNEILTPETIALRNGKRRGFIDGALFIINVLNKKRK